MKSLKRFKLLFIIYSTANGGAERSTVDLINGLVETFNHDVTLIHVSTSSVPLPKLQGEIKVINLSAPKWFARTNLLGYITFLTMLFRYDAVILDLRSTILCSRWLKRLGCKIITVLRAILIDQEDSSILSNSDCIIGISDAVTARVEELGYRGRIVRIYNGFKLGNAKSNISHADPSSLFYFGRLVVWKRVDWGIRAIKELLDQRVNVKLHIYGEGPVELSLKELVESLNLGNNVVFHGYQKPDDQSIYEHGIMILPSYEEPFGRTLVEFTERGKVIVASNSGGVPEVMAGSKLLFERDSLTDFVEKLKEAIINYELEYCKTIEFHEFHKNRFNLELCVRNYNEAICEFLYNFKTDMGPVQTT